MDKNTNLRSISDINSNYPNDLTSLNSTNLIKPYPDKESVSQKNIILFLIYIVSNIIKAKYIKYKFFS